MSLLTFATLLWVCLFWFVGGLLRCHPWGPISIKATRQKPDTHHKPLSSSAKAALGVYWSLCEAGSCEWSDRTLCNIQLYSTCEHVVRVQTTVSIVFLVKSRNGKYIISNYRAVIPKHFRNNVKYQGWNFYFKHMHCISHSFNQPCLNRNYKLYKRSNIIDYTIVFTCRIGTSIPQPQTYLPSMQL